MFLVKRHNPYALNLILLIALLRTWRDAQIVERERRTPRKRAIFGPRCYFEVQSFDRRWPGGEAAQRFYMWRSIDGFACSHRRQLRIRRVLSAARGGQEQQLSATIDKSFGVGAGRLAEQQRDRIDTRGRGLYHAIRIRIDIYRCMLSLDIH